MLLKRNDRGNVHRRNDCLADSLLQLLSDAGVLQKKYAVKERDDACRLNRDHLRRNVALPPQHRPQGTEFLQENVHSEPTILFFLKHFKSDIRKPLPPAGVRLIVHSVWSGRSSGVAVPPAESRICQSNDGDGAPLEMNLYNTTDGGISGLHFDPLFSVAL